MKLCSDYEITFISEKNKSSPSIKRGRAFLNGYMILTYLTFLRRKALRSKILPTRVIKYANDNDVVSPVSGRA